MVPVTNSNPAKAGRDQNGCIMTNLKWVGVSFPHTASQICLHPDLNRPPFAMRGSAMTYFITWLLVWACQNEGFFHTSTSVLETGSRFNMLHSHGCTEQSTDSDNFWSLLIKIHTGQVWWTLCHQIHSSRSWAGRSWCRIVYITF